MSPAFQPRRFPLRPSVPEIVALILICAILAAASVWGRRLWIEAMLRGGAPNIAHAFESPLLLMQSIYPLRDGAHLPVVSSGMTIETTFSNAAWLSGPRGLAILMYGRLACHAAACVFLALAMLHFLRRWAVPPLPAFMVSVIPPALYLWLPGPMLYHLTLWSSPSLAVTLFAALLFTDSLLECRRRDLPVAWMALETVVLLGGAWTGPYFWSCAALVFLRRLITARWRSVSSAVIGTTMMTVPAVMGAAAYVSTARILPAAPRHRIDPAELPGFWSAWMLEAYGVFGIAALLAGTAALGVVGFAAVNHAFRDRAATAPLWSAATLGAVVVAAPVVAEILIRLGSTQWDVDTLYYAPAVAVVPLAIMPAALWMALPDMARRWSLVPPLVSLVLAGAILAHEAPRYRGLLRQPVHAAAATVGEGRSEIDQAVDVTLRDVRFRPVDDDWCRLYVLLDVLQDTGPTDYLRIRGVVDDEHISSLPEHQRSHGYAEWFLPIPSVPTREDNKARLLHADLAMCAVPYEVRVDLVSSDVHESEVSRVESPLVRLGRINPFNQRDVAVLRNAHLDAPRTAEDWTVPAELDGLVKHEEVECYRGGALRSNPGTYFTIVSQDIDCLVGLAGRTIAFSAMARASEANTAALMITVGGTKYYSSSHPGDGGWHALEAHARVPWTADTATFTVALVHAGVPKHACIFDEARLEVR